MDVAIIDPSTIRHNNDPAKNKQTARIIISFWEEDMGLLSEQFIIYYYYRHHHHHHYQHNK